MKPERLQEALAVFCNLFEAFYCADRNILIKNKDLSGVQTRLVKNKNSERCNE